MPAPHSWFSLSALRRVVAILSVAGSLPWAMAAGVDSESVRLAATGQFDALERLMEGEAARRELGTRDRHALCYAYSKTKNYERLFSCLTQLQSQVDRGDRRTRLFGLDDATPSVGLMRAQALLELGDYAQARTQARSVIDWIDKEGSDDRDLEIEALATLVLASALNGESAEAQRLLKALEGTTLTFLRHDDYGPARTFALARSYVALGQYAQAVELLENDQFFKLRSFLDQVFSGAAFTGENYWMWAELPRAYLLAKCRLELGRIPEAKQDLDKLLALAAASANGEIYWLMLYDRGRIAEQEGQIDAAHTLYQRAVEVIERQRATIHTEINKIGFVTHKQDLYSRLISTAMQRKDARAALEAVERSKARALVDLLASKKSFGGDTATQVTQLSQAELQLSRQGPSSGAQGLRTLEQVRGTQDNLRRNHPQLASLVTAAPVVLGDIQQRIGADEVLVEFYRDESRLLAFVADRQQVQVVTLDGANLENQVRELRGIIDKPDESGPQAQALLQALHQRLFVPLQTYTAGKHLLIVPHGVLHYVPFAALGNAQNNPLIQEARVRILPSASVLNYLPEFGTRESSPQLLIFGNPDLGKPELDLPSAQSEAQHLAKIWPRNDLLLRQQASETAFKEKAGHYPYLHVASHGQFNPKTPLTSRLLLGKTEQDDGSLTVSELYALRLSAEMVVLSACETGLGGLQGGDDMVGLNRALIYAGSRNIVASLWEVDDASTATLMEYFYQAVAAGKNKAQALREAQNRLRQSQPHPFFWAAFYLTGAG